MILIHHVFIIFYVIQRVQFIMYLFFNYVSSSQTRANTQMFPIVFDSFRSLPIPTESFPIVSDRYRSKYVDYLDNFLRVLFVFIF